MSSTNRPTWCEYFSGLAEAAGSRADCVRRKVGAVFTYENRIIATGYNGTDLPGIPGCLSGACPRGHLTYEEQPPFVGYSNCISVHAERNGLRWILANLPHIPLDQVTVHINCQPCPECREMLESREISMCYPGITPCPTLRSVHHD